MEIKTLMNEVWKWEDEKNRERYVGRVKRILIHPRVFMEVAADKESPKYLYRDENGYSLAGIELIRTTDVETFEIQ
jgi:hypothetical protein